jgi:hypothetical protein
MEDQACKPIVATPTQDGGQFAWAQVYSKMWLSLGCISVVFYDGLVWEGKGQPSLSLAQEYGFMIGMGRPAAILVPDEGYNEMIRSWFDIHGVVVLTYPAREALPEELWYQIREEEAAGARELSEKIKSSIEHFKFTDQFERQIKTKIGQWCRNKLKPYVENALQ